MVWWTSHTSHRPCIHPKVIPRIFLRRCSAGVFFSSFNLDWGQCQLTNYIGLLLVLCNYMYWHCNYLHNCSIIYLYFGNIFILVHFQTNIKHPPHTHRFGLFPFDQDKQKWQVGWEEMSGSARALLRGLQLWLVPGEYQQLGLPPGSLTYPVKIYHPQKERIVFQQTLLQTTVTSGHDYWSWKWSFFYSLIPWWVCDDLTRWGSLSRKQGTMVCIYNYLWKLCFRADVA